MIDSPKRHEFQYGLYHVSREICRKFDRVSSVKRTSLYFKSRARPEIKHTSNIHNVPQLRLGLRLHLVPNQDPNFTTPIQIIYFHQNNNNNNISMRFYLNNPKILKY